MVMYRSAAPIFPSCRSTRPDASPASARRFNYAAEYHSGPAAVAPNLDNRAGRGQSGKDVRRRTHQELGLAIIEPAFDRPHACENRGRSGRTTRAGRLGRQRAVIAGSAADVFA